jgi:hypothetical protein
MGSVQVPVPRHVANVQMVGIARLRYRPRNRRTAAWWAGLQAKAERFLREYEALAAETVPEIAAPASEPAGEAWTYLATSRDYQSIIKPDQ